MRSRLFLLLSVVASFGCVHFPTAGLVQGTGSVEVVQGPVVCGPLGFRKLPLQSRWGEYVRVSVTAPSKLRGTVLVHALGTAQEPRTFEAAGAGALVVEARFPNEDPDVEFALDRERPIDVTLTGLEALEGGTCEGAVFTVEHGALVPSIEERAWIAELERRGGPELIARREARARAAAQARAEAQAQAEVATSATAQLSVEAWANAELRAQAAAEAEVAAQRQVQANAQAWAREQAQVAAQQQTQVSVQAEMAAQQQAQLSAQAEVAAQEQTLATVQAEAMAQQQAQVNVQSDVAAQLNGQVSADVAGGATPCPPMSGSSVVVAGGAPVSGTATGCATCASGGTEAAVNTSLVASTQDEWSQPFATQVTAEAGWAQPYDARLNAVAVSSESRVAVGAASDFAMRPAPSPAAVVAPAPPPAPVATATVQVDPAVLWVPGMLNLVFSAAAAMPSAPMPPQPAHGARPAR